MNKQNERIGSIRFRHGQKEWP